MESYEIQILETVIVLFTFVTIKLLIKYFVRMTVLNSYFKNVERKDILKIINLFLFVIFCIIIIAIWSVKQSQILVFVSSILTVLGVALFAEMSILSNLTACLILFFQHPIKIGDTIKITSEGQEIEGELTDISYFFIFIKTHDKGTLTIPNSLLLKSSFLIKDNNELY
jgi:small-conductance mechanosensitive channel